MEFNWGFKGLMAFKLHIHFWNTLCYLYFLSLFLVPVLLIKVLDKVNTGVTPINDEAAMYFENVKKGKATPVQAWTSPEDSRRMRLPDFKTFDT